MGSLNLNLKSQPIMRIHILLFIGFLTLLSCQKEKFNVDQFHSIIPIVEIEEQEEWDKNPNWFQLKEGEGYRNYFRYNDHIYLGSRNIKNKPIDATAKDFWILSGTEYAKDKYYFFHPIGTSICANSRKCGCYCYFEDYIIGKFNVDDFVYLGEQYISNKDSIYFKGVVMKNVDAKSFQIHQFENKPNVTSSLTGEDAFDKFATDKNNVFMNDQILDEINSEGFYLEYDSINTQFFIGDSTKKYQYLFSGILIESNSYNF